MHCLGLLCLVDGSVVNNGGGRSRGVKPSAVQPCAGAAQVHGSGP